jgi:hypothetical protein
MKTLKLEIERPELGRRPKKPRISHKLIEKVGQALYHMDAVKRVRMEVVLKSGSILSYVRNEDEDEFEEFKRKRLEEDEDEE